jgi:hypothetical protein
VIGRRARSSRSRIPLDLCRELLAGEAESLSDEEVELIRRHADAMAHLLIEIAVQGQSEG